MPEKKAMRRAKKAKRAGKAPSTQAGAFVHEEIEHVREGKHGARNTKQAIAIGLSKARRAGVKLRAPKKGAASAGTRTKAKRDVAKGSRAKKKTTSSARRPNATRSRASKSALEREGRTAATSRALSRQARAAANGRRRKRTTSSGRSKASAEA